jgi:hypothetical protein
VLSQSCNILVMRLSIDGPSNSARSKFGFVQRHFVLAPSRSVVSVHKHVPAALEGTLPFRFYMTFISFRDSQVRNGFHIHEDHCEFPRCKRLNIPQIHSGISQRRESGLNQTTLARHLLVGAMARVNNGLA